MIPFHPKAGDDKTTVPGLGELTIIKECEEKSDGGKVMFLCRCSCGAEVTRELQSLRKVSVYPKSCGHTRKRFGQKPGRASAFNPVAQDFYLGRT